MSVVAVVVAWSLFAAIPAAAAPEPTPTLADHRGGWWNWDGADEDRARSDGEEQGSGDAGAPDEPSDPVEDTTGHDNDADAGSDAGSDGNGNGQRDHDGNNGWGNDDRGQWQDLLGFAANAGGEGFWVLTKNGEVFALNGAPDLGSPKAGREYVAMAGHPRRSGFWVLGATGKVYAFGAATDRGSARVKRAVGIAAHRSGRGYWVASRAGKVAAFGKAQRVGDLRRFDVQVDRIVARDDADGYHLRTTSDRWIAFPNDWSKPSRDRDRDRNRDRDRADRKERDGRRRDGRDTDRKKSDRRDSDRHERDRKESDTRITNPRTEGGVRLVTVRGITVARRIGDNLRKLLRAADRDGASLGGWGYRSRARQIELRRAHCGTSKHAIYRMPSSSCSPPTARPGSSMHEDGLAIDFYKKGRNGAAISIGGTREFRWLKRKAARFGFYNLPSEPWHWSTNGH